MSFVHALVEIGISLYADLFCYLGVAVSTTGVDYHVRLAQEIISKVYTLLDLLVPADLNLSLVFLFSVYYTHPNDLHHSACSSPLYEMNFIAN